MFNIKKVKYYDIIVAIIISFIAIQLIINYKLILKVFEEIITILMPFILAFIIAYILNPILKFVENRLKFNRGISIVCTYILVMSLITIFSLTIIPKVFNSGFDMINNIPEFSRRMYSWTSSHIPRKLIGSGSILRSNSGKWVEKFSIISSEWLSLLLSTIVSTTTSLINFTFGIIISIYMLYDKEKFQDIATKLVYISLKENKGNKFISFIKTIHTMIGTYIGIKAIDSFIIGIICFIGLMIFKTPYVLILSIIVMITNMIPYFGPFMGMIPPVIINIFYDPKRAIGILVFLILLQQFDAWILEPKLVSNKVGVSPFLVILGITIFGNVFGVIGMLLASPIMAVLNIYVGKWFRKMINQYENSMKKNSL